MTTIVQALKTDKIDRITNWNRWLYWSGKNPFDGEPNCWHIRQSKRGKGSILIHQTTNEHEAVEWLLGRENDLR